MVFSGELELEHVAQWAYHTPTYVKYVFNICIFLYVIMTTCNPKTFSYSNVWMSGCLDMLTNVQMIAIRKFY